MSADENQSPEDEHLAACKSNLVLFWCAVVLRYNSGWLGQLQEDVVLLTDQWQAFYAVLPAVLTLLVLGDTAAASWAPGWLREEALAAYRSCRPRASTAIVAPPAAILSLAIISALCHEAFFNAAVMVSYPTWAPLATPCGILTASIGAYCYYRNDGFGVVAAVDALFFAMVAHAGGFSAGAAARFMVFCGRSLLGGVGAAVASRRDAHETKAAAPKTGTASNKAKAGGGTAGSTKKKA